MTWFATFLCTNNSRVHTNNLVGRHSTIGAAYPQILRRLLPYQRLKSQIFLNLLFARFVVLNQVLNVWHDVS